MSLNMNYTNVSEVAVTDTTANLNFIDVIGSKADASSAGVGTASVVALLRNIIANLSTDTDVAALIGALNTAAASGAVDNATTVMGYIKQLVTELQVVDGYHDVPTADVATNVTSRDVIGNKTDAAAAGAVSAVESLMAYAKQLVTEGIARDTLLGTPAADVSADIAALKVVADTIATDTTTDIPALLGTPAVDVSADILVIDGLHDVPVADAATNLYMRDVVGIKTDAAATGAVSATESLMAYAKQNVTEGIARDAVLGTPAVDVSADISAISGTLGAAVGASLSADIAANQTDLDAIIVSTVTNATGADVATDVVALQADVTAGVLQTTTVTTVDASVTPWTVAAHRLFTVTGVVEIDKIFAVVDETVVEGAGADNTVSVGTSDDVDLMIGVTVGDALVTNDLWSAVAGGSLSKHALVTNAESFLVSGTDIDINVLGTNSIADGTLTFYCTWKPISAGATLVAGAWD